MLDGADRRAHRRAHQRRQRGAERRADDAPTGANPTTRRRADWRAERCTDCERRDSSFPRHGGGFNPGRGADWRGERRDRRGAGAGVGGPGGPGCGVRGRVVARAETRAFAPGLRRLTLQLLHAQDWNRAKLDYICYRSESSTLMSRRSSQPLGFTWRDEPEVMRKRPWGTPNVRNWKHVDIWDTLNDPFLGGLEQRTVDQNDVNDHLFTALLTLQYELEVLHRELAAVHAQLKERSAFAEPF